MELKVLSIITTDAHEIGESLSFVIRNALRFYFKNKPRTDGKIESNQNQ